MVLAQRVGSAAEQDRDAAERLLDDGTMGKFPHIKRIWADCAYRGKLAAVLFDRHACTLEIVKRKQASEPSAPDEPVVTNGRGFELVRWRWIVERTFAWLGRYRRMSKDYEHKGSSAGSWMHLAMVRLMLGRLTAPS